MSTRTCSPRRIATISFAFRQSGTQPATRIEFRKPWETKAAAPNIARRLGSDEKLAIEWLHAGNFDKALAGYLALQKANPNQQAIQETYLNELGYRFLNNKQLDRAIMVLSGQHKTVPRGIQYL